MGYSVVSSDQFRLTQWVKFNQTTMKANWDKVVAVELYDYDLDPLETRNVAYDPSYLPQLTKMSRILREHFSPEIN